MEPAPRILPEVAQCLRFAIFPDAEITLLQAFHHVAPGVGYDHVQSHHLGAGPESQCGRIRLCAAFRPRQRACRRYRSRMCPARSQESLHLSPNLSPWLGWKRWRAPAHPNCRRPKSQSFQERNPPLARGGGTYNPGVSSLIARYLVRSSADISRREYMFRVVACKTASCAPSGESA